MSHAFPVRGRRISSARVLLDRNVPSTASLDSPVASLRFAEKQSNNLTS